MSGKYVSVIEYFTYLFKKYHELQKPLQENSYRILEVKKKSDTYFLKAQIIGKSQIFDCLPQEIAANDKLFQGFSKSDIRTITYLAMQNINQPKYKIITQEFSENLKNVVFKIKQRNSKKIITKTASEVSTNKDFLDGMNQMDAHLIGYVSASESIFREQEQIAQLKHK